MKTFAGEGGYFCCGKSLKKSLWLTSVGRVEVLSLLKTEELAPLNRLKGASDPAEDCWNHGEILLLLGVNTVSTESYSDLSWLLWIVKFYYSCYSNLSPCFSGLGYCRNSNLLMAGTVDNAGTVQNSGWCWSWIVTIFYLECWARISYLSHTHCKDLGHLGMDQLGPGWLIL